MSHREARRMVQDIEKARRIMRHQHRHSIRGKHRVDVVAVGSVLVVPVAFNDRIASIARALRKAIEEVAFTP